MKFLEVIRFSYGLAMILFPAAALNTEGPASADPTATKVMRVLGARHLVQAVVVTGRSSKWHTVGGAVDILHALTAAAFATANPKWRRPAAVSSLISLAFAAGEIR